MNSYCLDVETFIGEVKKYPEIWDINSDDHRFKSKKQQAWAQIARVFITDFDEIPDIEKYDVYRKLHGKWRNIRDSFVRHRKRKYGKKGYVYAKHLTFLSNLYNNKTSQSGSDVECDNQSDDEDAKLKSGGAKTKRFDLLSDSTMWASDPEDSPSTIENLKRKRTSKEETDIEYVDTPFPDASVSFSTPVEDEDRSFFESLLPAVREFNMDQKLEFRSEVLCLIKGLRSSTGKRNFIKLDPTTGDFS
ncbi:uncharacterized protein LOC124639540 [Helicoverpa zea]|uniref:uncharacterized protein LOC124639540 n=1 Tax=Helicoverpa zea TaxID=7113 RepID=UPI001F572BCB|nr:uncharacterized protein LOC124639540 [Helicoverpa zea]